MVDEATKYNISIFLTTKDELPNTVATIIKKINLTNKVVKYVRSDNACENRKVAKGCTDMQILNITFDYTAPYTPQQNGVVE